MLMRGSPSSDFLLLGKNQVPDLTRRNLLQTSAALAIPPGLLTLIGGCKQSDTSAPKSSATGKESGGDTATQEAQESDRPLTGDTMHIQYLEIVTPEAEELCAQYAAVHGLTFGEPDANVGGARIAKLEGGTSLAIRGPLRETETPVIRPYMLVEDIKASVDAAAEAGAEVALPPMELPGHGTCAIVIRGGIECGFWQN